MKVLREELSKEMYNFIKYFPRNTLFCHFFNPLISFIAIFSPFGRVMR